MIFITYSLFYYPVMETPFKQCDYPSCRHIKRTEPDKTVDKDVLQKFLSDSDVLPLAESKTYDYIRCRHYSLLRNELLRCRWEEYKNKAGGKIKTPFIFPNDDDFHFYMYLVRYAPDLSLRKLMQRARTR